MNGESNVSELRALLRQVLPGNVSADDAGSIGDLLTACWDEFKGSNETGMKGDKLGGRMEELRWVSPILSFKMERHGGAVLGSKRAEMYLWEIDICQNRAGCHRIGYRNLRPNAPALDVNLIAGKICVHLQKGPKGPFVPAGGVSWKSEREVTVKPSFFIPNEGPKATLEGRRKRLRLVLVASVEKIGWDLIEKKGATLRFKKRTSC